MSEIEKMYENTGIEPDINYICDVEPPCEESLLYGCKEGSRSYDIVKGYPEFTAEKQLKLVEFFISSVWWMNLKRLQFAEKFEEGLAQMINELWQDLTEEEKQQVKGILE